jgi:RNA polymerase sigma factor (sigma-70 family)
MTEMALPGGVAPIAGLDRRVANDLHRIIEEAYAIHAGPLTRRLTAQTRDGAAAEDLVHEAFLRLAGEIRAGRTPDNVGGWLHRVAGNLLVSRGRHATVAGRHQASLPQPGTEPSPEAASISAEEGRLLHAALGTLGATDRRALVMAAHGYRGPEIALRLGRSDGATRTLLCRARSRLRSRLEAAGIDR